MIWWDRVGIDHVITGETEETNEFCCRLCCRVFWFEYYF